METNNTHCDENEKGFHDVEEEGEEEDDVDAYVNEKSYVDLHALPMIYDSLSDVQEDEQSLEDNKSYVDKGYAWVIALASFSAQFLLAGYMRTSGVVFVEIQKQFDSSSSLTSLINGIQEGACSICSFIFLGFVLKRTNPRFLCLSGSLFLVVGIASNFFAASAKFLIFTHGVCVGTAVGSMYGASLIVLSDYFVTRRALATSLVVTGSSIGGIVFPLVDRQLFDAYGFHGGFLLLGGICAHCFVFSMLLTPVNYLALREKQIGMASYRVNSDKMKNSSNTFLSSEKEVTIEIKYFDVAVKPLNHDFYDDIKYHDGHLFTPSVSLQKTGVHNDLVKRNHNLSCSSDSNSTHVIVDNPILSQCQGNSTTKYLSHDSTSTNSLEQVSFKKSKTLNTQNNNSSRNDVSDQPNPYQRNRSVTLLSKPDSILDNQRLSVILNAFQSTSTLHHSIADISAIGHSFAQTKFTETSDGRKAGCGSICRKLSHMVCSSQLTQSAAFWVLAVFFVFSWIGYMVPYVYIPALAKERGLTEGDTAFLLVILNVLDLPSRLIPGIIVNTGYLQASSVCILPMTAVGVAGFFTPLLNSYESVLGLVIVYGLFGGFYTSMQSLIVIEVVGLKHYPAALAFCYLVMSMGTTVSFPVAGLLKDVTGTYSSTYFYLSTIQLIAVVILLCLPVVKRIDVSRGVLL